MKVYPVVHINSPEVAVEQAELAYDLGADGVFLIDHRPEETPQKTYKVFNALNAADPARYVGVNLLGYTAQQAADELQFALQVQELDRAPDALWNDDVLSEINPRSFLENLKQRKALSNMQYLGGIAFKYTPEYTDDPVMAAIYVKELESSVDVVTTSGAGTGSAPPVAKIAAMKEAASKPLAVASGISLENIADYKGIVDQVLVASSVETSPYSGVFDKDKLEAFIAAAHS